MIELAVFIFLILPLLIMILGIVLLLLLYFFAWPWIFHRDKPLSDLQKVLIICSWIWGTGLLLHLIGVLK